MWLHTVELGVDTCEPKDPLEDELLNMARLKNRASAGRENWWNVFRRLPTNKNIFNNKTFHSKKKKGFMFLYVSFISFHSKKKKRKLLGKNFPGFQGRCGYSCYTKCGSRSPGKLRSQAWVFCCVPHGFFPWPTCVERRLTQAIKHPKKSKWIQNVMIKWFKNVIFQNSLLEVCLLSLSHLQKL